MAKRKQQKSPIDRPFAGDVEARAAELVRQYAIVSRYNEQDGEWHAHAMEYPEAIGVGESEVDAIDAARQSAEIGVCVMLEEGQRPPAPAREQIRTQQINVRVTPEEKAFLETRSREKGFRGLSDFVRAKAMTD